MASKLHLTPTIDVQGASIVLHNLVKYFDTRPVLRGINLEIAPGEFVALLGPSGCGKTTLLRIIAGLEAPTRGETILHHAHSPTRTPTVRVMFQEDRLLPWQRVHQNVALGLPARAHPRISELLAAVGLGDREGDWPASLSGGQKQRVALARALAHEPDLLLLDEPFGALDALTRAGMQRLLAQLCQQTCRTVVLVTHDVEEALLLADRIVVLQEGQVVSELQVTLPRPRHRGDPWLAARKEELLESLLPIERAAHLT